SHDFSSSRSRIVLYLARSILVLRAASARAAASACGVRTTLDFSSLPRLLPVLGTVPRPPAGEGGEGIPARAKRSPLTLGAVATLPVSSTFSASGSVAKTLAPLFVP